MNTHYETQPLTEPLDLYDACGVPLGITKPRYLVHKDGDWHKTFHCWIIYKNASGQEIIVFQKRGDHVELWPGKLDITAAGHYRAGEGIEGGVREIQEELGIPVEVEELHSAGIRVNVDEFQPGLIIHEFQDVYVLIRHQPLASYMPQPEEVAGLVELPVSTLLELLTGTRSQVSASGILLHQNSGFNACDIEISSSDFIPSLDHYYHRVAILAQRMLRGEPYLWL